MTSYLTRKEYFDRENKQKIHRGLNTLSTVLVVIFIVMFIGSKLRPLYEDISGIREQRVLQEEVYSEIEQVGTDEGYRRCVYKDSLGYDTIGWGHLMLPHETYTCIDPHYAVKLLRKDYTNAEGEVLTRYPWANEDVKLILINMTFNMGSDRLSKFKKTLEYLEDEKYDLAAGEVLDSTYAKQVPNRAARIATRIMRLQR